jgi:hypothetical protein
MSADSKSSTPTAAAFLSHLCTSVAPWTLLRGTTVRSSHPPTSSSYRRPSPLPRPRAPVLRPHDPPPPPPPSSSSTQVLCYPELLCAKPSRPQDHAKSAPYSLPCLLLLIDTAPPLLSPLPLRRSLEPEIPTPAAVELLCVAIFNMPDSYLFTAPDCRLLHAAAWNTSTLVDSSPAPPHMFAS